MMRRCLPLVSLPKLTVPVASARIAGSFGLRASNRSATRGRPPVMSRVFRRFLRHAGDDVADADFVAVLDRDDGARRQEVVRREASVPGKLDRRCPCVVDQLDHRTQVLAGGRPRCFGSMTTMLVRPVTSSVCWV